MTMKAAVWTDYGRIELKDVQMPKAGPGEALIRVMSAGVCVTDLHVYTGRFRYGAPPHILGHEIAGEIAALGENPGEWTTGDRVVVETSIGCGKCRFCRAGRRDQCPDMTEIGTAPHNGAYAQYLVAPAANLFRIPDNVSFDEAGILESVICPMGGLYRLGVGFDETVAVFGVGPAGIAFIQGARAMGAGRIIAVARNDERLARARSFGATETINAAREDAVARILAQTGGGADLVCEAAGVPSTIEAATACARRFGRVILYGLPGETEVIPYPVKDIILKQLAVHGACNNPDVWAPLLNMVSAGRINLKDMVTHSYPLDGINDAFAAMEDRGQGVLKAVVHPWP